MSTQSRPARRLSAALAAFGATLQVVAAQADVKVTLQLARIAVHECEPLWVSFRAMNRSGRQLLVQSHRPSFCFERRDGDEWREAGAVFDSACEWVPLGRRVPSGDPVHGEVRLAHVMTQLGPGVYRVRAGVPVHGLPGAGWSDWQKLEVLPHAGNRAVVRRREAIPPMEPARRAWVRFLSGSMRPRTVEPFPGELPAELRDQIRRAWPDEPPLPGPFQPDLSLLEYQRHLQALAAADVSPGLAAELQLEQATIADHQAHRARLAGMDDAAAEQAKAGLALLDALTAPPSTRLDTGGQPATIRETRIHLLSVGAPEQAAVERERLEQDFPLRATIQR